MFRLPRIRSEQGLLVASETDISENGVVLTTDRIICFRALPDDTPWATHRLSTDGLTEKTYLHLPMCLNTAAFNPVVFDKVYLCAIVDIAERNVGGLGILIDE